MANELDVEVMIVIRFKHFITGEKNNSSRPAPGHISENDGMMIVGSRRRVTQGHGLRKEPQLIYMAATNLCGFKPLRV